VAVLGAPDAEGGLGAAYVVERTGGAWAVRSKLTASGPVASVQFGSAVSVSGDTILVGAWRDEGFRGAAYVFTRGAAGAWTQRQRLLPSDRTNDRRFGISVAVSGDTAVIGAVGDAIAGEYSGSAYVFVRDEAGVWTERQKLTPSEGAVRDFFGASVAVSGGTAVVGAPKIVGAPPGPAAAYVFTRDDAGAWAQSAKLSDGVTGSGFAGAVALSGDTAVVGAAADEVNRGAAYVFEPDGAGAWVQRQKLTASDAAIHERFGESVAVFQGTILAGSRHDDDAGSDSGSVYVLARADDGLWAEQQKLTASDGASGDTFGSSVALSRGAAVVGAPADDDGAADGGTAYVYALPTGLRTSGDLSGTERLRMRGAKRAGEDAARRLSFGDGGWLLTDEAGPQFAGTYVERGRSGRQLDLACDDASTQALLVDLSRTFTEAGDGTTVTAALRGTPRITVRLNRALTRMVLTATVRATGTAEGATRARKGVYTLRLSGPVSTEK
jgi:hypothetical protein